MRARFLLLPLLLLAWNDAPPRTLRVCADPANLPFSNERGEGFENRVAALVASELGAKLETTWWVQRRGFFRNTLNADKCDVVIGVPKGVDMVKTTKPWYRSTFAFVSRKESALSDLHSIDDARLKKLVIGVPLAGDDGANPAPIHALNKRGIVDNVRGFHLYAELGRDVPAAIEALENKAIDVAILWGPVAGVGAKRGLVVVPVAEERDGDKPFAFSIAMGTRKADAALASELDRVIDRRGNDMRAIVRAAGVPLLEVQRAP